MAAGGAERAGQVYHGISKLAEAEEYLREAIALGREMGLAPRELVRPYHWLGETLWWQGRYDGMVRIGEESAELAGVMEQIAPYYREKMHSFIAKVTKLMEPGIIVVMGGTIAGLMLAIYLPMFDMAGNVH